MRGRAKVSGDKLTLSVALLADLLLYFGTNQGCTDNLYSLALVVLLLHGHVDCE